MENAYVISQIDGQGREDSLYRLAIQKESSQGLVQMLNPERPLNLCSNQLLTKKNSIKDCYRQSTGGIDCRIPRHMVNLDEKYLRRCMEWIHISASTGKISVNYSSGMMGILTGGFSPAEGTFDSVRLVPLVDVVQGIAKWPEGRGNKSLKSPLHRYLGSPDGDVLLRRTKCEADKASNFMNSSSGSSNLSSIHEVPIPRNYKFGSRSLDRGLASVPTCSDHSSTDSISVSQGMLQCKWRSGSPHFIFYVDGEEEVYVANLSKADSTDAKDLDYVYFLHSTKGSQKASKISHVDSHLVGKIEVSTSFTISPNNSRIRETEFVLYCNNEKHMGEMQTSSHSIGKPKTLSKKVVDVLRTKQRTMSEFILENCFWDPHHDPSKTSDELGDVDLSEKHLPPNFELAAIVVKDHISDSRQRETVGWGLKFLKNTGIRQTVDSLDCSKSMDILLPAGLHGGPRSGPSSLIDRWKRGHCDCGGWDMGCPLTVINTRPSTEEALHIMDPKGECKTLDLSIKTSEHNAPSLRMVNVQDGLYLFNYQSVLSALQSFSIAIAFMHAWGPQNMYRS